VNHGRLGSNDVSLILDGPYDLFKTKKGHPTASKYLGVLEGRLSFENIRQPAA
jgi:hypothetical protein